MYYGRSITLASAGALLLFALPLQNANAQIANTLAFYDFNNGTATDNSGNGNNGVLSTPSGPTATTAGLQGDGFQFNASDNGGNGDYFTSAVNLSPSVNPNLTFGGWFLLSGAPTPNVGLISNDTGGYRPTLDIDTRGGGGTTWSAFTGNGVLSSGVTATAGVWTFVAGVYNESSGLVTLYVDPSGNGTGLVSTSAADGLPTTSQQGETTTTIGRNPNFDNPFNGTMDNIFFVGSALSASQIQSIDSNGQSAFLGSGSASAPEPGALALAFTGALSALSMVSRRRAK